MFEKDTKKRRRLKEEVMGMISGSPAEETFLARKNLAEYLLTKEMSRK